MGHSRLLGRYRLVGGILNCLLGAVHFERSQAVRSGWARFSASKSLLCIHDRATKPSAMSAARGSHWSRRGECLLWRHGSREVDGPWTGILAVLAVLAILRHLGETNDPRLSSA